MSTDHFTSVDGSMDFSFSKLGFQIERQRDASTYRVIRYHYGVRDDYPGEWSAWLDWFKDTYAEFEAVMDDFGDLVRVQ